MILKERNYYRPFEYPKAYDFYRLQQQVHWTKDEIKLAEDISNWHKDLTNTEKEVIGGILKGFTQMEVLVGDYWREVAKWFPKPEVAMMASTFSYFEGIHMDNYAMINEELNLDDFQAFLYDEKTKAKIDYFIEPKSTGINDIAKSLAIFSAFAEGCMLFSSFAVLLSFQKENLMKGVGQIVSFSIRDENLHSEGGCWLFNIMCSEIEGLRDSCFNDILEAAAVCYKLEEEFIDNLFKGNSIRTLDPVDLKEFIKHRINSKLKELGYEGIFTVSKDSLKRMQWFDMLASGREFGDFFATRVTEYTTKSFKAEDLF